MNLKSLANQLQRASYTLPLMAFAWLAAFVSGCSTPTLPTPGASSVLPSPTSVPITMATSTPAPITTSPVLPTASPVPGLAPITVTLIPSATATGVSARQGLSSPTPRSTPMSIGGILPALTPHVTPLAGVLCASRNTAVSVAPTREPSNFEWSAVIRPMNDPCIQKLVVDPKDDNVWYAGGENGLYITRDAGASWTVKKEIVPQAIALAPQDTNQVYVGVKETLYSSGDKGQSWKEIGKFDAGTSIRSLYVNREGTIFVGLHWAEYKKPGPNPEGIYVSRDRGATWQLSPFGTAPAGLINWVIAQDPRDGTLYVGNEIFNHPKPYKPPFLRSKDGGKTWQEISGVIDWHVIATQIDPQTGYVYALTEGGGLFGSSDQGDHWQQMGNWQLRAGGGPTVSLALDPKNSTRLLGGAQATDVKNYSNGGVFMSLDKGINFTAIGLRGVTVGNIAFNSDATRVYVAAYPSGIYTARIPR